MFFMFVSFWYIFIGFWFIISVVNFGFLVFIFVLFGGVFVFEFVCEVVFFFLRENFICVCLIMVFWFLLELEFFVKFFVLLEFIFLLRFVVIFLCVLIYEGWLIMEVLKEGMELFVMKGLKLLLELGIFWWVL